MARSDGYRDLAVVGLCVAKSGHRTAIQLATGGELCGGDQPELSGRGD